MGVKIKDDLDKPCVIKIRKKKSRTRFQVISSIMSEEEEKEPNKVKDCTNVVEDFMTKKENRKVINEG